MKVGDDILHVSPMIDKTHAFRICQLTDDIKSKILQPVSKIEIPLLVGVSSMKLGNELFNGRVHKWLKLNQAAHCIGVADFSTQPGMENLIG